MYDPLPIPTDPAVIARDLIGQVNTTTGTQLGEAHPITVMLEAVAMAIAQMNQQVQTHSSRMFDEFGHTIVGVHRHYPAHAIMTATLTTTGGTPEVIPAGTVIQAGGFRWELIEPVHTTPEPAPDDGDDDGGGAGVDGPLSVWLCQTPGVAANHSDPAGPVVVIGQPAWHITLTHPEMTGGADGETIDDYRDRLAATLTRFASTAITPDDMVQLAYRAPGVGHAAAFNRVNPATPGEDAPGHLLLAIADTNGQPCDRDTKQAVRTLIDTNRIVNITVHLTDPAPLPINVTIQIVPTPGYEPETVTEHVTRAVTEWFRPGRWDQHGPVIYPFDLAATITTIPGVAHTTQVLFNGGTGPVDTTHGGPGLAMPAPNITVEATP